VFVFLLRNSKFFVLIVIAVLSSCSEWRSPVETSAGMPERVLWAWERPENLEFIDTKKFGVAFLAQTITIDGERSYVTPRRQPLKIKSGTFLTAVTRIESGRRPEHTGSEKLVAEIVENISATETLADVGAIQIDFDAVESEREFYRKIIGGVRRRIEKNKPLSVTALASWCSFDLWLDGLPIDEAIPMLFDLGTDGERIESYLHSGRDWREPLCRKSYGLSVNQKADFKLHTGRRIYYFNKRSWNQFELERLENIYEKYQ
jgi:hypothetical protein